jgi:hypothetical protein
VGGRWDEAAAGEEGGAGFGPAAGKKAGGIWGRAARLPVDKEETRGRSREVHIGVGGFSQAEQQVVGGSARSGKGGSRIVLLYIYILACNGAPARRAQVVAAC